VPLYVKYGRICGRDALAEYRPSQLPRVLRLGDLGPRVWARCKACQHVAELSGETRRQWADRPALDLPLVCRCGGRDVDVLAGSGEISAGAG
jgi:hypothetical protein